MAYAEFSSVMFEYLGWLGLGLILMFVLGWFTRSRPKLDRCWENAITVYIVVLAVYLLIMFFAVAVPFLFSVFYSLGEGTLRLLFSFSTDA